MRTNRFIGLRIGTAVWRRLLVSCRTTIATPNSAHVFRTGGRGRREYKQREELNPTQNSPRRRGPRLSPSRLFPAEFPRAPHPNRIDRIDRQQHSADDKMPDNVVESPYPLIDADPHFSRVVRYMRPSDYAVWASATAAFPSALYFWGM